MTKQQQSILKHDNCSQSTSDKEVCWGDIALYEFPSIMGDNPGVSSGAPLTIGWKHSKTEQISIEYYEYLRRSNPRRTRKQLVQNAGARGSFLLSEGYTMNDILKSSEEVDKIKDSRRANMKGRFDNFKFENFKDVFMKANIKSNKKTSPPRILASKSA
eukprot:CAMPEP_0198141276 /NCGR_PEP_ID=MMETSP1443-20131203/4315_1 /TAXON_ID=186043 /ORGANISM="Entomoneis sp., Strain CCMP2396" /LENGTH=158 /DNA_ID=CAMNT_0043803979 /DNA_START=41 /DNA_END=517 /DNA_ORIENTATION=+